MKEDIISIIVDVCKDERVKENENINLLEEDIIDSLGFIMLIEKLNEKFDIEIQPTQVESNTWKSVENIEKVVKRYIENK